MKRSSHRFECRDDVWARVIALAEHRSVSTDDVVEAALVQLFLKRNSSARPGTPIDSEATLTGVSRTSASTLELPRTGRPPSASGRAPTDSGHRSRTPSQSTRPSSSSGLHPRAGLPNPPSASAPPAPRPGGSQSETSPPMTPMPPSGSGPIPVGTAATPSGSTSGSDRPLYLLCEGQWYTIDQEQFVIGRGKKYSDMAIKDANISRRHCAIVRRDGEYFIRDLGSTNGIEFGGVRVDDHMITEDSTYYLCNHELRFTFQAPRNLG